MRHYEISQNQIIYIAHAQTKIHGENEREMDVLEHNDNSDNQCNDNRYEVSSQIDYQLDVNSDHNVSSEGSVHFTDSSEENASSGS